MTAPVRSAYFMLSSSELQTDFDGLVGAGFLNQWNYPSNSSALLIEFVFCRTHIKVSE
jgi:hypothetical protein